MTDKLLFRSSPGLRRAVTMLTFALLLSSGCASNGTERPATSGMGEIDRFAESFSDDRSEYVFRILLGELAGRRGMADVAFEQYLVLSQALDDPLVSERAVRIGLFTRRYRDLLPAAERWVELDPENVGAQRALALVLVELRETSRAAELFAEWLGDAPDDPDRFSAVTGVLQRAEDNAVVLAVLAQLADRYGDSALIQHAYALSALRSGDTATSMKAVDRALAIRDDWPEAWLLKSQVLMDQGRTDEASRLLRQVSEQRPDDVRLGLAYVRLLLEQERLDEARVELRQVVERIPDDSDVLYSAGLLAAQADDMAEAEAYLTRALEGKRRLDAYFELGRIAEQSEQYGKAMERYSQVTEGERVMDARVRTGHVMVLMGRYESARAHFVALRRDNPGTAVSLYLAESESLREAEQIQRSYDVLDVALDAYPGNHDLLYARALMAERLGRLTVLERDLSAILETDPDNAHALNALGYTLADRTERYDEALKYIQRAHKLMPDDAAILDSMGWVLYRLKRFDEALSYLQRAYDANPDEEIAAHLGEVLWVSGNRQRAMDVWNSELERVGQAPNVLRAMQRFGI